jgi:outer membrane beta-barrel protein
LSRPALAALSVLADLRIGRFLAALSLIAASLLWVTHWARAQCVDEALKQQLIGQRAYRGVVPRKFQKALRHELSPMGGWYAADLADGAAVYGGAYTFHVTEHLGLEAAYFRTRQRFGFLESVDAMNLGTIRLLRAPEETLQLYLGHVVWSLAYGKVRWLGGAIGRFDFSVALGAGASLEPGDRGITGSGGFGMKFYLTQWLALRLDVRDLVRQMNRQQLGVDRVVNDITAMGGLSLFIPFSN